MPEFSYSVFSRSLVDNITLHRIQFSVLNIFLSVILRVHKSIATLGNIFRNFQ